MNNIPQKGFTLIELIVFMTVLSFLVSSTFAVIIHVMRYNGEPNQALKSATLARSRMEILLLKAKNNYALLSDPCEQSSPPDACKPLNTYAAARQLTVTSAITERAPNKTLSVTVSDSNNSYALTARVSDYE